MSVGHGVPGQQLFYGSIVLDNEDKLVNISVQRLYIHAMYFFGLKIIFVI